jgi:hypothetical protein
VAAVAAAGVAVAVAVVAGVVAAAAAAVVVSLRATLLPLVAAVAGKCRFAYIHELVFASPVDFPCCFIFLRNSVRTALFSMS